MSARAPLMDWTTICRESAVAWSGSGLCPIGLIIDPGYAMRRRAAFLLTQGEVGTGLGAVRTRFVGAVILCCSYAGFPGVRIFPVVWSPDHGWFGASRGSQSVGEFNCARGTLPHGYGARYQSRTRVHSTLRKSSRTSGGGRRELPPGGMPRLRISRWRAYGYGTRGFTFRFIPWVTNVRCRDVARLKNRPGLQARRRSRGERSSSGNF